MIDQKQQKRLLNDLQEFGLSEKEAAVYFALLPRRDIGSSKIVLATGLHKQFVYNSLARLEELGLAKHVIQNGRKKFSANSPKRILSLIEEKRLVAQGLVRELEQRFAGKHEQDFEVIQGVNAFVASQLEIVERTPKGGTIDVISGPNDQYFQLLDSESAAQEFEEKRIEKDISVRYIGAQSQIEKFRRWEKERRLWSYRILPGLSTGIVDLSIWPETVMVNTFGEPLLSFVLTSREAANGYREFFQALWNLSAK